MKPNIIFMGTPEFAVPTLDELHTQFGVKAVVTVPDKPKGRGLTMQPSPVKQKSLELGIPVLQPEKMKDEAFINELASYEPDIICVVAFRILPPSVYNLAKIASFNIHGSLLPKYRGAAPINWAIINGEKETGLTSFILQEKVDTGDMLLQKSFPLSDETTAGELHDMLMPEAAAMAVETCELLLSGNYEPLPQPEVCPSPAPKLFREHGEIDWTKPAQEVLHKIHGLSPYPGAWTVLNGKSLKIYRVNMIENSQIHTEDAEFKSGEYFISETVFAVKCADGWLAISELQQESKKPVAVGDFIRGWRGDKKGKLN